MIWLSKKKIAGYKGRELLKQFETMKLKYIDPRTKGKIHFIQNESVFEQNGKDREGKEQLLTIALNSGEDQKVVVNGTEYHFASWTILPLFFNQSFKFEKPEQITAWQYNRDFYCIVDHDREVSCVGFLFFGSFGNLFIQLDAIHRKKLDTLQEMFIQEFDTSDNIQADMLRMLLRRLIIIATRLAKEQYVNRDLYSDERFDLIRQYSFLVEKHFKTQHQVQFYANELNRSPKTLSNLFALCHHKSPLQIIHERIILEAKKLFFHTDRSAKEIAYELGFEDAAHFSRFFKNFTHQTPSELKKYQQAPGARQDILPAYISEVRPRQARRSLR
jgi:AraC family transcriptional regulator, transcriptional activator of pobA